MTAGIGTSRFVVAVSRARPIRRAAPMLLWIALATSAFAFHQPVTPPTESPIARPAPRPAPPQGPPTLGLARGGTASLQVVPSTTQASVVDPVVLTIEARIPVAIPADPASIALDPVPTEGEPLGDFTVAAVRRDPPALDRDAILHRWTIDLEPSLPGEARVPPISLILSGQADQPLATSEPIALAISSVLEGASGFAPGTLRPPLDPAPLPAASPALPWLVPVLITMALGLGATFASLAWRPTPARRLRRALRAIHRRGRHLSQRAPSDDPEAALAAVSILRDALTLIGGPTVRGATAQELMALLAALAPSIQPSALARWTALLAWTDRRLYAADPSPPPEVPDIPATLAVLRASPPAIPSTETPARSAPSPAA